MLFTFVSSSYSVYYYEVSIFSSILKIFVLIDLPTYIKYYGCQF